MNRFHFPSRLLAVCLAGACLAAMSIPASAFFFRRDNQGPYVSDFAKNGLIGSIIAFAQEDFAVQTKNKATLNSITIQSLPDPGAGILAIGGQSVQVGTVVDSTALSGLRFQSSPAPSVTTTQFTFLPSFSSGQDSKPTTVTIHLLTRENQAPIARDMELSTYRNIAITGHFDAVDSEGDVLTYQILDTPARGSVKVADDGSSQFVYTPYENKSGRDHFTYVAVDPAGNTSQQATVNIQIDKAGTRVTYADLDGHSAHKAAIRLAEEGIYTGRCMNGLYFFDPEEPVTRAQFLSMAMAVSGTQQLQGVTVTGFYDDSNIPVWAKGFVSAALKAGAIFGSRDETGAPVFRADDPITHAQACVMLNNLLGVSDVPVEVFSPGAHSAHWAAQAQANLAACGVLNVSSPTLSDQLTLGEAAQMLDGALDLLEQRAGADRLF